MGVQLNIRQIADVSVVDVSGRITLGDGSSTLRNALREMGDKGQRKILLNLADLSYVDSSGIGELVSAFSTLAGLGGRLKLVNLTNRVKDLLLITKLYTVFEVYTDEATAVASFAGPPAG
jgi:anti-sigma B factor antagonist